MKRAILSLLFCTLIGTAAIHAQCTPNTSNTTPGITPDSATGLNAGVVGQLYSQILQVKVPTDTTTLYNGNTVPVHVVKIVLDTLSNLPPGLTYSCNPANATFPGGSNGCVAITGTPTLAGVYHLRAILTSTGTFLIFTRTQTDTVDYYTINVTNNTTGLNLNQSTMKFAAEQNSPNPVNDFTQINYTVPSRSNVDLRLYNIIGKEIYRNQYTSNQGFNTISFDAREFSPGIYMYTLTSGNETISKRMVISRK